MSEPYRPDNILDRRTATGRVEIEYAHLQRRERELLDRHLPRERGDVVSVGCGWRPGRHLFPAPQFRLVAVDMDANCVRSVLDSGEADEGIVARAGELPFADASFDVVLYRLVLHHVAYREPLERCFEEAARLLRPGGALVAVEPGLLHPVGLGLTMANRLGLGTPVHGTPDDIPLPPWLLKRQARRHGLDPRLFALSYSWRRLPPGLQRALWRADRLGERPLLSALGHTLLLIARKPQ
jgi:SAM-dependent methyltransferase